jgi:hypothetical protein
MTTLDTFPLTEASKFWQPTTSVMEQETQSFPLKLHAMLDEACDKNFAHIVAWQDGGKSFKVYDAEAFATQVMRSHFNQTKYKSFQRQLNLYGFRRIHHGPHKGGYAHKFFMRGQPHLTKVMSRHKVARGLLSAPENTPSSLTNSCNKPLVASFTTVTPKLKVLAAGSICDKAGIIANGLLQQDDPDDREIELFSEFFQDTEQYLFEERQSMNLSMGAAEFEALMNTISVGDDTDTKRPAKRHMRLSLSGADYDNLMSNIYNLEQPDVSASHMGSLPHMGSLDDQYEPLGLVSTENSNAGVSSDTSVEEEDEQNRPHSFPWKLHEMLEDAEKNNFQDVVSWELDGTAFKVHKHDDFLQRIMPIYFDQTKYESFRRQLNLYGFSRVSRGPHRGIYLHKCFLRDDRPLCENIARHKSKSILAAR